MALRISDGIWVSIFTQASIHFIISSIDQPILKFPAENSPVNFEQITAAMHRKIMKDIKIQLPFVLKVLIDVQKSSEVIFYLTCASSLKKNLVFLFLPENCQTFRVGRSVTEKLLSLFPLKQQIFPDTQLYLVSISIRIDLIKS